MIVFSAQHRSHQKELMDNLSLQGEDMKRLLTDLKRVNRFLGGNSVTLKGIDALLKNLPEKRTFKIIDLGCGDGEMLRVINQWSKKKGYDVELIGVDANTHILEEAKRRTSAESNIQYKVHNVFDPAESTEADIVICTLFLHHFSNEEIVKIMNHWSKVAKVGVVINDLHRSFWAFHLFGIVRWILLRTRTARHDGLVSVARGFRKKELRALSERIPGKHSILWKWAFRYQWIINKT